MLLLLFALPLLVVGLTIVYRVSPTVSARKRAVCAVAELNRLRTDLRDQEDKLRQGLSGAGQRAAEAVRSDRMKEIPVDRIKTIAPGVRLQALKDAGLKTLLDLQGWNSTRLSSLKGIGPKSAGMIAVVVNVMTNTAKSIPIPCPSPPFTLVRDRDLVQATYCQMFFDSGLPEQKQKLENLQRDSEEKLLPICRDSAFFVWILSLGLSDRLKHCQDSAERLVYALANEPETVLLVQELSSFLEKSGSQRIGTIPIETLTEAYRANERVYTWMMARALGHSSLSIQPPSGSDLAMSAEAQAALIAVKPSKAPKTENTITPDNSPAPIAPAKTATEAIHALNRIQASRGTQGAREAEELVTFRIGQTSAATTEIPLPSSSNETAPPAVRWIVPSVPVTVQGITISRAYFHLGPSSQQSSYYVIDPLLPAKEQALPLADDGLLHSSYAAFNHGQRFRYLRWLSEGALDDSAPPSFGLLYFQGLEKRALQLLQSNSDVFNNEIEPLLKEVRRAGSLFRSSPYSVSSKAIQLLSFFAARALVGGPAPPLSALWTRDLELPFEFRLSLGMMIKAGLPVPPEWALRWAHLEPNLYLRTAATRCPEEFSRAFKELYAKKYGDGLVIRKNKTELSISYQPMYTGGDNTAIRLTFPGTFDVKAMTSPQQAIRELAEQSTVLIDPYSRLLGPGLEKAGKLEALLVLPASLWPDEATTRFEHFRSSMVEPMRPNTCEAVLAALDNEDEVTPHHIADLARRLQTFGIGFEPDVLAGARRPKPADAVVLFMLDNPAEDKPDSETYLTAQLCVEVAAVLALADGHASVMEADAVDQMIAGWKGLAPNASGRLRAHYRLCVQQSPTIASLKSRLEKIGEAERRHFVGELSRLAAVDGVVSPAEVKLLERIYAILKTDTQALYSDLHGANSHSRNLRTESTLQIGSHSKTSLDPSRIRELRQESSLVSQLLADVFAEEDTETSAPMVAKVLSPGLSTDCTVAVELPLRSQLPGLNPLDQRLLALLMSRHQWPRQELLYSAKEMQIMLDGALERINDAALDHFGDFLVEGDDPIFVQQSLLETAE